MPETGQFIKNRNACFHSSGDGEVQDQGTSRFNYLVRMALYFQDAFSGGEEHCPYVAGVRARTKGLNTA